MQSEAEAFLQRIRAYPDDDAPRLIYADWLEERGDPRGEFIRVQLALARQDDDGGHPREVAEVRSRWERRERDLLEAHRETWTAPLQGLATGAKFRRGFIEEVNVTARQLVERAHELFAIGPIRHLRLLDVGSHLTAALQCPYLGRLNALTIHAQHAGEPLARAVAQCSYLSRLKLLCLSRNRLDADAVAHLAASPVLANLEELDLSENELGEAGARTLAASPQLGQLRRLEVRANQIGPMGAESLAASTRLGNLTHLGLAENEVGSPRIKSLTTPQSFLRVPRLDFSTNSLTPAGLEVILPRSGLPGELDRLQELNLSHNELGTEGARLLAASPRLAGVRVLRLIGCGIDDDGARALAQSPHLNGIEELDLGNNPINDSGFRAFLDTAQLHSLRRLIVPIGVSRRMREALDERFHEHDRTSR
jgi:uncharacterized protein (TIGR02996 family)